MASNIDTTGIDELYPIAGVDNDSQGFRDNFANIKTNLDSASTEITALQAGVARVDGTNDFNGNVIQDASLIAVTETINTSYATGVPANGVDPAQTSVNISFAEAGVYDIQALTSVLEILPTNFPANRYASMRLILSSTHTSGDFGAGDGTQVTIGAGSGVLVDSGSPFTSGVIAIPKAVSIIVDVFSYTGGNTIYAHYVGEFS